MVFCYLNNITIAIEILHASDCDRKNAEMFYEHIGAPKAFQ